MSHRVLFSPEAAEQLESLYRYIAVALRITNYRKRAVIAFEVGTDQVSIVGVFYGGQDHETMLHDDPES